MSPSQPTGRRCGARILAKLVGLIVIVLVILVAMAPTLVNWGVGRGAILGAIGQHVDGTVAVRRIHLGWFGSQSVEGLEVAGRDGRTTAMVDAQVGNSLLSLLTGPAAIEVDLAATLRGELHDDGTTSFEDLLAAPGVGAGGKGAGAAGGGGALSLDGVPPLTVTVSSLDMRLTETGTGQVIELTGAKGRLAYRPGGPVSVELQGATGGAAAGSGGGAPAGSIKVSGEVAGLFDSRGAMTLDRAAGHLDVEAHDVRVPLAQRPTALKSMTLAVKTDDPTKRIEVSIGADAVIDGTGSGRLAGDLSIDGLVAPGGAVRFSLDRVHGRVSGESMPAALFQQLLRGTPIVAARDLGPTIDLDARFGTDAPDTVAVTASAQSASMQFTATLSPQRRSLSDGRLHVTADVHPELAAALTGLRLDRPAGLALDVESLSVPAAGQGMPAALAGAAARGTLILTNPVAVTGAAGDGAALSIGAAAAQFDTADASQGGRVSGAATVNGTEARAEITAGQVLGDDGLLHLDAMPLVATVTSTVAPEAIAALLPGQADLVRAALDAPVDVSVKAALREGALSVDAGGESPALAFSLSGRREGSSLHVQQGSARLRVTPPLVALLQAGADSAVVLAGPATASLVLEPVSLPLDAGGLPDLANTPITGNVTVPDAVLAGLPDTVEAVGLRDTACRVTVQAAEPITAAATGRTLLRRAADGKALASVEFDVKGTAGAGKVGLGKVTVDATNIDVNAVDAVLGRGGDRALAAWLGDTGSARAGLSDQGARVTLDFPAVSGQLAAQTDGGMVTVTATDPKITLRRGAIEQWLAPAGATAADRIRVERDLPLALALRSLRVPLAMFKDEPFDPAQVAVNVGLTAGGPLVLNDPKAGRNTIDGLTASLVSRDLSGGVDVAADGSIGSPGAAQPGRLHVGGRVTGLVQDGRLSADGAKLALQTEIQGLQTAVVDAAAGLSGLLVAAVGPRIDMTATANGFSRRSGFLDARIDTPNGWLKGRVHGSEAGLVVRADEPVTAQLELTPPFRDRILRDIHPVLADIRTTEQPIKATVGRSVIPLDGDVSKLVSDLEITVGAVELDSGSTMLGFLNIYDMIKRQSPSGGRSTIHGSIEPIKAAIRKGVVTYERFAVRIDKFTLAYSGRVDLVSKQVDLRTEIPVDEGLRRAFKELSVLPDGTMIPFVTRGPIDSPRTDIDPAFWGKVVEAFAKKQIQDQLGKALGDLFKK